LQQFSIIVLGEVDHMLDMGFIADVTGILDAMAESASHSFFSAALWNARLNPDPELAKDQH